MAAETAPDDMHEWKVTTDSTADATNVGNFLKVRRGQRPRAPHPEEIVGPPTGGCA